MYLSSYGMFPLILKNWAVHQDDNSVIPMEGFDYEGFLETDTREGNFKGHLAPFSFEDWVDTEEEM